MCAVIFGMLAGCKKPAETPEPTPEPTAEATPEATPEVEQPVAERTSDYEFEDALVEFIEANGYEKENYMVSPTSFRAAMALAVSGADSDTKGSLLKAMGFESEDDMNAWYATVENAVKEFNEHLEYRKEQFERDKEFYGEDAKEPEGAFSIENSVWRNTNAPGTLSEKYIAYVNEHYDATAENVSADKITDAVNNWVDEKTHGLIKKISDDLSEREAVLVNTLYLKTSWYKNFTKEATQEKDFTTIDGKTVKMDFMNQQDSFRYYEDENGKFVILPMEGNISAIFILGDVGDVISKLSEANYEETHIELPKFETETSLDKKELVDFCKERGASIAFSNDADFSRMSEDMDLYISDIIQKTKIKTDEDGIEAAAVTAIMMDVKSAIMEEPEIKEFIANEPFKYLIVTESENPEILFCGQVVR